LSLQMLREKIFQTLLKISAILCGGIVIFIALFIALESIPFFRSTPIYRLITDQSWHPTEQLFNLAPMLWGSIYAVSLAILIAVPIGILVAIYIQFYAQSLIQSLVLQIVQILSGVPSVVFGLWGLVVLSPLIAQISGPGTSLLAGGIMLSIIVLPLIVIITNAQIEQFEEDYIKSALALGMSRQSIIIRVILPGISSGLYAGISLQIGRALGETMVVLMVCGNVVQAPLNPFEPVRALTANIALEMAYALGDHRSALFVSGLLLLLLVSAISMAQTKNRTIAYV